MKIAAMGAGAIGGYVGARLAVKGAEVTFIARGRHLAAIREAGFTVQSPAPRNDYNNATSEKRPARSGLPPKPAPAAVAARLAGRGRAATSRARADPASSCAGAGRTVKE